MIKKCCEKNCKSHLRVQERSNSEYRLIASTTICMLLSFEIYLKASSFIINACTPRHFLSTFYSASECCICKNEICPVCGGIFSFVQKHKSHSLLLATKKYCNMKYNPLSHFLEGKIIFIFFSVVDRSIEEH